MFIKIHLKNLKQRGIGSLFLVLGMGVGLAAAVVGGQKLLVSNDKSKDLFDKSAYSEQSTKLLIAYASLEGRLPCPATYRGGSEDCTSEGIKGWLPVATLNQSIGPFSGVELKKLSNIRYLVNKDLQTNQRDLAAVDDVYQPYIKEDVKSQVLSLNDWCYKLDPDSIVNSSNNFLSPVLDPILENSSDINLNDPVSAEKFAFATIVAGSSNFDDVNASNQPVVRSPIKKTDDGYADTVRIISKGYLSGFFQCGAILQSMEQIQIGAKWTQRNWDERDALVAGYKEQRDKGIPKEIEDWTVDQMFLLAKTNVATGDVGTSISRLTTDLQLCVAGGNLSACMTPLFEAPLFSPKGQQVIKDIMELVRKASNIIWVVTRLEWHASKVNELVQRELWDERQFLVGLADILGPILQQRQPENQHRSGWAPESLGPATGQPE
jgi:hypothetical protein